MKNIILSAILLVAFLHNSFGQNLETEIKKINSKIEVYNLLIDTLIIAKENLQLEYLQEQLKEFGLPKIEEGEKLIEHKALMLVYSEKHEQAKWVAHIISTEIIDGSVSRTNNFRADTLIKTGSAVQKDYFLRYKENGKTVYDGFGYDRGHLAPSADFKWSKTALSESYFYSNMSPQLPEFNREGWAKLEGMLRAYIYENNVQLFIITAPVLTDDLKTIPKSINKISIPNYFYKIAFDMENNKAIGFLVPHEEFAYPIEYYAVSIDSIESLTGIDFFANINDSIEQIIESQTDYKPFLPKKSRNDVAPLKVLPKNCINTVQAFDYIDSNKKVTVCGTVVSTHKSKKNHIFINIDKSFPKQIFSATIWASNVPNFSYAPEKELQKKKVCITGKVVDYKGTTSIYIDDEKHIEIIED